MPPRLQRLKLAIPVFANGAGNAIAQLSPTGAVDYVILSTSVRVQPPPNMPASTPLAASSGITLVDGVQVDTTDTGNSDTSDTRIVLFQTETMEFHWSGCTPGALCTLSVFGVIYPSGQAPLE